MQYPVNINRKNLALIEPSEIAADDSFIFYINFPKKIRLGVSRETSVSERVFMKYQAFFFPEKKITQDCRLLQS